MEDPESATPAKLADFEIVRRLGTGGMAEVFLAKRRGAERTFKLLVVKRILPAHGSSRRFRTMFAEEAQLATRLNHPNIVQVYDFQDYGDEGQLLSMEYVDGPDLRLLSRAARQTEQRLPPFVSAFIISEVGKGLHYAHERRGEGGHPLEIVHRDISPQNVLLSMDGAVKVADFGIATANVFRQEPGVLKGKTAYMSPEQASGEAVDRRTDIYSLGVVFHELLTARPLHGSLKSRELLEAVRAGNVEPPSLFVRGVPEELEAIVMKALSRRREDRYATARAMTSEITRVLFKHQQLVDSHTLEEVIQQFLPRDLNAPAQLPREGRQRDYGSHAGDSLSFDTQGSFSSARAGFAGRRADREVRHVAIVTLMIHGREALEQLVGKAQTSRLADQLRSTLDDLAFKHGTRFSWSEDESDEGKTAITLASAQATLGLMTNPSAASSDAARMSIDVHEAIAGACYDLPAQLHASVSIVRGIAEGRRDRAGHLTHHVLQKPAPAVAAALGQSAAAGQTLAAGGIYRLLRRDFVWQEAGSIEMSWEPADTAHNKMRAYKLERQLTQVEKREKISSAPRDLIGRDAELADLHAAYHQAIAGSSAKQTDTAATQARTGQLVTRAIVGEMGIGKSALVTTFLRELPPDARGLRVESSVHNSELPYASAGQWLRELTGIRLEEPIDQAKRTIAEVLGDLPKREHTRGIVRQMAALAVGQFDDAVDEAEADVLRESLATGMLHFFAKAAQRSPLTITIDALQWIDAPSLKILSSLIRRSVRLPVLLLLVTRADRRIARVLDGVVRVELGRLTREHQTRLIEAHVGADEGVAEACAELLPRAAGNPFFLLEMVDALLERGLLDLAKQDDGHVRLVRTDNGDKTETGELPSTLEQLIADRLNELPPNERTIIDWLAVAGGPLSFEELSSLIAGDVADPVVQLVARGMCDSKTATVDVRHPLARDVSYLALSSDEREGMHQQLGELLSQGPLASGLEAAAIAKHFSRGVQRARAANYYLIAADAARSSFQLPLATRYYNAALEALPETDEKRLRPHAKLEEICRIQGRWEDRRRHLLALRQCATRSGNGSWVALALTRHAQFDADKGDSKHALHLAQQAEQVARQTRSIDVQVQAQSLMAEVLGTLEQVEVALKACNRALELAQAPEVKTRIHGDVLRTRATLLLRVGRVQEAIDTNAEAIAIFRLAGARRQEARTKSNLAFSMMAIGNFEDSILLAHEALQLEQSLGGRFQVAKTVSNIAQSYAKLGDTQRALNYFQNALDAHERFRDHDSRADTLLWNAALLVERAEHSKAEQLIEKAEKLNSYRTSTYDEGHARLLRGLIARYRGDCDEAVTQSSRVQQIVGAQSYVSLQLYAMSLEAAARMDNGESDAATVLATTCISAAETMQGCTHSLEVRRLCVETLEAANAPQASDVRTRTCEYVLQLKRNITSNRLRRSFGKRVTAMGLLEVNRDPALSSDSSRLQRPSSSSQEETASPPNGHSIPSQMSSPIKF